MSPALRPGQTVVVIATRDVVVGDIVVAEVGGREVVKRVTRLHGDRVQLMGDNRAHSTDSRDYGLVNKSAIIGRMTHALPVAVAPPKVRHKKAPLMGWIAAGLMCAFAVVHLFRIDTFVPEMSHVFADNRLVTAWVASAIVTAEVFAVPFLLRMRLSPLAQYVSGALGVFVPLFWLLIAIWTYGTSVSTAQLGEFHILPSSGLLIVADGMWLLYAYITLWALGYDRHPREKPTWLGKVFGRLSKSK